MSRIEMPSPNINSTSPAMLPSSLRLTFPTLSEALHFRVADCPRAAADVDVKVGNSSRGKALLNAARPASVLLDTVKFPALSLEVRDPGFGALTGLGAVPRSALRPSRGEVEMALVCPDALTYCGTVRFRYLRTDEVIELKPVKRFDTATEAKFVSAGIGADDVLYRANSEVDIGAMKVSRTALRDGVRGDQGAGHVVLVLDLGATELLGGEADVNVLVSRATLALSEEKDVVALATADMDVATVLVARTAARVPVVWCGEQRGVARRLKIASIHDEGDSVVRVVRKDDDVVELPPELFAMDVAGEAEAGVVRRRSSVHWANPLVEKEK